MSVATVLLGTTLKCASGSAADQEALIDTWVRLAEKYALGVKEVNDQYEVWLCVARFHAKRGNLARARQVVYRIDDEKLRNVSLRSLARTVADLGDWKSALRIVGWIEQPAERDLALSSVACVASSKHDFAAAEATIELLDDWGLQQELWYGLASEQASAGHYDLALKTANRFRGLRFGGQKDKAELLESIAKAKRTGTRKERIETPEDIADLVRDFGGSWPTPDNRNADALKARARKSRDPGSRAVAWYLIARAYHQRNQIACRRAIQSAVEVAPEVPGAYDRLLYSMLIADFLIRLGDSDQARQLVQETLTREALVAAFEAPDEFALGPKTIAVLVRLGDVQAAFETTKLVKSSYRHETWWALGAFCAVEGKLSDVEKRLTHIKRNQNRALLCTGVAAGLHQLYVLKGEANTTGKRAKKKRNAIIEVLR